MKKKHMQTINGGKKPFRVSRSDLVTDTSDFYNHALPEMWSLKLKARRRMEVTEPPLAANQ